MEGNLRGNVVAFSVIQEGAEQLVIAAEGNSGDADRLKREISEIILKSFGISPAYVAICPVGALPKTSSGKAQRRKTKSLYENRQLDEHRAEVKATEESELS